MNKNIRKIILSIFFIGSFLSISAQGFYNELFEKYDSYKEESITIRRFTHSKIMPLIEELKPDYSVSFVDEIEPLGTAGSLQYLNGKFDKPFFVTNCDIIIKADYVDLYEFHQKGGYDITLVASAKEYIIPYGTCELNGDGHLSHINEKPKYDFLINTGLYILNPDVLSIIPKDKFYHITHMIEDLKNVEKEDNEVIIDEKQYWMPLMSLAGQIVY